MGYCLSRDYYAREVEIGSTNVRLKIINIYYLELLGAVSSSVSLSAQRVHRNRV